MLIDCGQLCYSVPAAKILLTSEHSIDVNLCAYNGETVLDMVNKNIAILDIKMAMNNGGEGFHRQSYLFEQLSEMKSLLVAKGAVEGDVEDKKAKLNQTPRAATNPFMGTWEESCGVGNDPLKYDVSCLFGKDLQRGSGIPRWQKDGLWICDDKSKQFEAYEGKDHLRGGRTPEIGQRIKLQFRLPNESMGFLDGKVVEISRMPTGSNMRRNRSSLLGAKCHCSDPECSETKTGKRLDILAKHGALHGQEVKGTVKLAKKMRSDKAIAAFFGTDTKYDIILRCNDSKHNMWLLARIDPHNSGSGTAGSK